MSTSYYKLLLIEYAEPRVQVQLRLEAGEITCFRDGFEDPCLLIFAQRENRQKPVPRWCPPRCGCRSGHLFLDSPLTSYRRELEVESRNQKVEHIVGQGMIILSAFFERHWPILHKRPSLESLAAIKPAVLCLFVGLQKLLHSAIVNALKVRS